MIFLVRIFDGLWLIIIRIFHIHLRQWKDFTWRRPILANSATVLSQNQWNFSRRTSMPSEWHPWPAPLHLNLEHSSASVNWLEDIHYVMANRRLRGVGIRGTNVTVHCDSWEMTGTASPFQSQIVDFSVGIFSIIFFNIFLFSESSISSLIIHVYMIFKRIVTQSYSRLKTCTETYFVMYSKLDFFQIFSHVFSRSQSTTQGTLDLDNPSWDNLSGNENQQTPKCTTVKKSYFDDWHKCYETRFFQTYCFEWFTMCTMHLKNSFLKNCYLVNLEPNLYLNKNILKLWISKKNSNSLS